MAVKWLLHWQANPGATLSSQILTEAFGCAESLGGVRNDRWRTLITVYRPLPRDPNAGASDGFPRELLGITLYDWPGEHIFLLRHHRLVLRADAALQTIMEKLQSYRARAVVAFEGYQYQLGDFRIRVGKCSAGQAEGIKGIMMEVEYIPLSSVEKSRQVMEDFFDIWQETVDRKSLPGHFNLVDANYAEYGLQDLYTPQHTAVQYAACMAQLMATARG